MVRGIPGPPKYPKQLLRLYTPLVLGSRAIISGTSEVPAKITPLEPSVFLEPQGKGNRVVSDHEESIVVLVARRA